MLPKIEDYIQFVGEQEIEKIKQAAESLKGTHIIHVNSTYSGGGVAEILNSLVILMNRLGIETGWRLLKGSHSFFDVTKKLHNALQGEEINLTERKKKVYLEELEKNALMDHFENHDLIVIHDPQPLALIKYMKKKQPWLWRCHIDIRRPNKETWNFLLPYITKYNGVIFSTRRYRKKELKIPQFFVAPSIDPLSPKNIRLSEPKVKKILSKNGIDMKKPIITQVSRFDKWKNPMGVIRIFKEVKEKADVQLVLIGDIAADDPEGPKIYSQIAKEAENLNDIHIITKKDDILVNALQRASSVVFQNSIREGFALTVAEALWKGTPVIATNVGGIPLQVIHKKTGILIKNKREAIKWCIELLNNENLRKKLGENGKEHVRKNFLITRHLHEYLQIFKHYTNRKNFYFPYKLPINFFEQIRKLPSLITSGGIKK